jgi:hypothetical protein
MVHVVSSQRLRRVKAKGRRVDVIGYIESFFPRIIVFYVLASRI